MKIESIIEEILERIPEIKNYDDELHKKFGIDPTKGFNPFTDENAIKLAFTSNPALDRLEHFLLSFKVKEIIAVESVMYYGRDGEKLLDIFDDLYNRREDKDLEVNTVLEKYGALPNYFQDAFEQAKNKGIDLNTFYHKEK